MFVWSNKFVSNVERYKILDEIACSIEIWQEKPPYGTPPNRIVRQKQNMSFYNPFMLNF